ncbi:MAG: bacterioferritin [Rickettsiales bacterium]
MAANKAVVKALNTILKNELTAINQYYLHCKLLKHQGFAKLAAKEYEESIDEMKHADVIADRILLIGGLPNFQDMGRLHIGETPAEMIKADHDMEVKAIKDLRDSIAVCEEHNDITSSNLLQDILEGEEGHHDWLRQQLDLIAAIGEANYLQSQM